MNDRRLRLFWIDQQSLFCIIKTKLTQNPLYCVLLDERIPDDVEVVSVHHDFARRTFAFTLRHESFSEVPEGEYIPDLFIFGGKYRSIEIKDFQPDGVVFVANEK